MQAKSLLASRPQAVRLRNRVEEFTTARVLGLDFMRSSFDETVRACETLATESEARLVVTANLAHAVLLADRADFRAAYETADVRVADGWPIVAMSRLKRDPLPGRVTGVDLAAALLDRAHARHWTVVLMNGSESTLEQASARLGVLYPAARFERVHAPVGYQDDFAVGSQVAKVVAELDPDLVLLCTGAPQSEVWFASHKHQHGRGLFLSCGGTIDVLAGTKRRAPRLLQRLGLEWLFRALCEPLRLGPRYVKGTLRVMPLAWRDLRNKQR
jgi:N-acetylglucosaminyldiphosphoundecaprenol N-acetyl-beta-D-mannosaminyltransferase